MKISGMMLVAMFFLNIAITNAQDSLQQLFDDDCPVNTLAAATFKTTRIVTGQSVEIAPEGELIFTVSHHFGRINGGLKEFFGLDQSTVRLGLEYGIMDGFGVSLGRSSYNKMVDGGVKIRLIRQQKGERNIPVTAVWYSTMNVTTLPWKVPERENLFAHRISYAHQLMIARKFNANLSLQLTPTLIHYNLVPLEADHNDIPAIGFGGRYKILPRFTVNAEYYFIPESFRKSDTDPSFSLGVDLETGGHVFQLFFTNSMAIYDPGFIVETNGKWNKGEIFFGFNIARVFTLK